MFCTTCAWLNASQSLNCSRCGGTLTGDKSPRALVPFRDEMPLERFRLRRAIELGSIGLLLFLLLLGGWRVFEHRSVQADAYHAGVLAAAGGDLVTAQRAFADAGGYQDAPELLALVETELAPVEAEVAVARAELQSGAFDRAIASLLPVVRAHPNQAEAASLLDQARQAHEQSLRAGIATALDQREWVRAEGLLLELRVIAPDDEQVMRELAALQREHTAIAFTDNHQLYVQSNADATASIIVDTVPAAWPVWSPDRSRIAFLSPNGPSAPATQRRLFVVAADGTDLRELATGPAPWSAPVWSPDGRKIAVVVEAAALELALGWSTVAIVDLDSGEVVQIPTDSIPNASSPTWSPDGDAIAFVSRFDGTGLAERVPLDGMGAGTSSDIFLYTLASGEVASLSNGQIRDPWRIAWSPTTDVILVYCRADGTSYNQGTLYRLDAATGMTSPLDLVTLTLTLPVWSPDGQHYAYVAGARTLRVAGNNGVKATFRSAVELSRYLTWDPGGRAVLVGAAMPIESAFRFDLDSVSSEPATLPLRYDGDTAWSGPPAWAAINPIQTAGPPSIEGTGLDPERTTGSPDDS